MAEVQGRSPLRKSNHGPLSQNSRIKENHTTCILVLCALMALVHIHLQRLRSQCMRGPNWSLGTYWEVLFSPVCSQARPIPLLHLLGRPAVLLPSNCLSCSSTTRFSFVSSHCTEKRFLFYCTHFILSVLNMGAFAIIAKTGSVLISYLSFQQIILSMQKTIHFQLTRDSNKSLFCFLNLSGL